MVITASNVTFDPRGRSIDGMRGSGSAGVRVKGRNVVVLNGLVGGFREGVVVEPGGQLDAQRMSIWSNDTGVSTRAGSSGSRIYLSTFKDNPFGVLLRGNAHTVDRSYFDVIHSSARGYVGVLVDGNAGPANGNIVSGNTMHNASIGVGVAGEPASSARSTTILRNSVFNGRPGTFGLQSAIVVGTAQGTQVSSNVAGQQEDGILVLESAVDTTLLGNNANRNDGFEVLSPSTTITKNRWTMSPLASVRWWGSSTGVATWPSGMGSTASLARCARDRPPAEGNPRFGRGARQCRHAPGW